MKQGFFLYFFCICLSLAAQEHPSHGKPTADKGVLPLSSNSQQPTASSTTRAVVIGISDYQDKAIPDLKYAHIDADAFAQYLHSPFGKNTPAENIRLLLNEQATIGQLGVALDWLLTETQPGDSVIFYFSGHGDMEARIPNQLGFLLLWDSPARVYAAGALPVNILQQYITALSVVQKAYVWVIIDACRAGKLARSEIIGPQLTNANLTRQWANEVKVLSCQPDEFSIEGEQWGGGRGVFSYYLINGLIGRADADKDRTVSLLEIRRYLEDHVPPEVAPLTQTPITVGDLNTIVARVDQLVLDSLEQGEEFALPIFEPVEQRGLAYEVLGKADSGILQLYAAYEKAIAEKRLLNPAGDCADYYFEKLLHVELIKPLYPMLRRNFAAALLDESQQVMNKFMVTDPDVMDNLIFSMGIRGFVYKHIPDYLKRAIELLGENHLLSRHLQAKSAYFEAMSFRQADYPGLTADSLNQLATSKLKDALKLDSSLAFVWLELGKREKEFPMVNDSLIDKALALSPKWVYAHHVKGWSLVNGNPREALAHFMTALEIDSNFLLTYQDLSTYYRFYEVDSVKWAYYKKAYFNKIFQLLEMDPENVPHFYQLFLGANLVWSRRYAEAEKVLKEANRLSNFQDPEVYKYLAQLYRDQMRYEEAKPFAVKAHELNPKDFPVLYMLESIYFELGEFDSLKITYEDWSHTFPNYSYPCLRLGTLYQFYLNDANAAEAAYKSAFALDTTNFILLALLAELYKGTGREEESRQLFKKILSTVSEDATADEIITYMNAYRNERSFLNLNLLGRSYLGLGDMDAMEKLIEKHLKLYGKKPWLFYQIACLYSLAGQQDRALEWLEKALEFKKMQSLIFYHSSFILDSDLNNIRNTEGYREVLRKYFPSVHK